MVLENIIPDSYFFQPFGIYCNSPNEMQVQMLSADQYLNNNNDKKIINKLSNLPAMSTSLGQLVGTEVLSGAGKVPKGLARSRVSKT